MNNESKMKRIEIIYSQALHEDLFDQFSIIPNANCYTIIPMVHGKGFTDPKMGDDIWPETNEIVILYTESDDVVEKIKKSIAKIKGKYPREGCAMFVIESL